MCEKLIIGRRGQVTLPAGTRKRLGIRPGDVLTLEERNGEVVLRPTAVIEVQHYDDQQIAQWDAEDRLDPAEERQIRARLTGTRNPVDWVGRAREGA